MIAYNDTDERSFVPKETHIAAVNALQDTALQHQADAHAAMQLLSEARKLLRAGLVDMPPVRRAAWNKQTRGFLDGDGAGGEG